jgi:hypothetical protein
LFDFAPAFHLIFHAQKARARRRAKKIDGLGSIFNVCSISQISPKFKEKVVNDSASTS